jgi:uncharacterized protein (DUF1330 family)
VLLAPANGQQLREALRAVALPKPGETVWCACAGRTFGGEVIVFGPWELLVGEGAYHNAMIFRFPDKDAVLEWYNSPTYQALIDLRNAAFDCRIRLVG